MDPTNPAQVARAFRMRQTEAESLRQEAAAQGFDTSDLDQAIATMRRLDGDPPVNDPTALAQLHGQLLAKLKDFEFALLRATGMGTDGVPVVGARAIVPAAYRALVEEYYRQLSRKQP